MNIPLASILRKHVIITPEIQAAEYPTADRRLMNLVALDGREYKKDNNLVWQLLPQVILETSAWNYVKQYDETQNGRIAFLTLQTRGEGEVAVDAQRAMAEDMILKVKYTGKSSDSHYSPILTCCKAHLQNWRHAVLSMPYLRSRRCRTSQKA
jgi:hypothetical protein